MSADELLSRCNKAISKQKYPAYVTLILPGRYGKTNTRRLCKGGPVGKIVGANFNGSGIVVMFYAEEVKRFLSGLIQGRCNEKDL